ncbi:hypothetical protein [Aquimonas voraii]|uniref:Uncharacterized protein n=1 Tax=Aquimonas voraii TaxID=265719 RepID=A0A1G6T6T6_9GAMM|nr:hypothetical protein [Aquimonas voraii]SDD24187.1 hypothetical protein SAMN04488509_101884 [Aquimonas voraii]
MGASKLWGGALALLVGLAFGLAVYAGTLLPDLTARGSQPGLLHPIETSGDCMGCHAGGTLEFHYPATSWKGSMMANAGRDPVFWAALDVANADGESIGVPGVGDWCLRCHVPEGWFAGRVSKTASGTRVEGTDGCLLQGKHDDVPGFGNDYAGVGCHYCHRAQPNGPNGEPNHLESGDVWLDDEPCENGGSGPCRGGPYDYAREGTSPPPHPWKQSSHLSSSEMCGSCHDVTSPLNNGVPLRTLVSAAGVDTGIAFPIERTYSEWRKSDYGSALFADGAEAAPMRNQPGVVVKQQQTCQDCHMEIARSDNPEEQFLACFYGPNRNGTLSVHNFSGANAWVPKILKGEFPGLGYDEAFDQAILWSTQLLTQRTALLSARGQRSADGQTLEVEVEVTNRSGHKLPTGYSEGRRMWIELEVRDAQGSLVYSNGSWDPATGELQRDAQTRVYEIKQGIWDPGSGSCRIADAQGRASFHFVLNNCVAKDNRIPPLGFTGGNDVEIAPVGAIYPPERPGSERLRNVDMARYSIPVAGVSGPLTVQARLHFQISSKEYVEFLRDQAVERDFEGENAMCEGGPGRPFDVGPQNLSRGAYLYGLWSNPAYGRSPPILMESASAQVP